MIGQPDVKCESLRDIGEKVLATLLARFERGAPPFFRFAFAGMHDGVAGDEGLDGRHTEFYGLLDDKVHILSFGDRLGKGDDG